MSGRYEGAVVILGEDLLVLGGLEGTARSGKLFNDVWRYDADTWTLVVQYAPWDARAGAAAVAWGTSDVAEEGCHGHAQSELIL